MLRILEGSEVRAFIESRRHALADAEEAVKPILDDVQKRGDAALIEWANKLDGLEDRPLAVQRKHIEAARKAADPSLIEAMQTAIANIKRFAEFQMPETRRFEPQPGLILGQLVRPLESIGAYVPGGVYPLPSTLLMTVVPAQVAGVPNICVVNPRPVGDTLAAADLLGIDRFFRVGGAQAIAALAFGTDTIPRVNRIVGPGNQYVAAAKKLLAGVVAIDSVAGPSEVLIIANDGNPAWISADMVAQAEHDINASAIFITDSRPLANLVAKAVADQLETFRTADVATKAIEVNSAILLVSSADEAMEISNLLAPEHLCLHDAALLGSVQNAGSVFLGSYSTESLGDYATGPNHVLPTSGAAHVRGGLSVMDFVKIITFQEASASAVAALAPCVTRLARAEGLEAHARAVEIRL